MAAPQRYTKFLLLIGPLAYLLLEYFKLPLVPHYYSTGPDPSYIYLFNGLNIANGNWELGHYDNPGTPLHILTGLLLYFQKVFSNTSDFTADVLSNPEHYLRNCIIVLVGLKVWAYYYMGHFLRKKTNLLTALFFQLMPWLVLFRLSCPALLHPDLLLDSIYMLLVASVVPLWTSTLQTKGFKAAFKMYWLPAMLLGLAVGTKFTSIGLLPLLLFSVNGWRNSLYVLLQSVLFFYLFTLPVFSRLDEFFAFITGIATHEGMYGSGEESLFHLGNISANLIKLFSQEVTLALSLMLIILTTLIAFRQKQKTNTLIGLGLLLCFAIQSLLVTKHYSYHYTLPLHYLLIPILYLLFIVFHQKQKVLVSLFAFMVVAASLRASKHPVYYTYQGEDMLPTEKVLAEIKHEPVVYVNGEGGQFLNSSSALSAMYFGKYYSGYHTRWKRAALLDSLYPQSYFYNKAFHSIDNWNNTIPLWQLMQKPLFYVYQRNGTVLNADAYFKEQLNKYQLDAKFSISAHYQNQKSDEVIYEVIPDTSYFNKAIINTTYTCKALSEAIQLEQQTLHIDSFAVDPFDHLEVTVLRKGAETKNYLELRSASGFYHHTGFIQEKHEGWDRLKITYEVPPNFDPNIIISLRNAISEPVQFKCLSVNITKAQKPLFSIPE